MGLIHLDIFTSLDGVAQAPGGPDEDPEGGFRFGGWQAPLLDEVSGAEIGVGMSGMDALLLGRKTYDIFAGYWPEQGHDGPDGEIAELFDRIPKYVGSHTLTDPAWHGTTVLGTDLVAEVGAIRDRHEHIHVIGSLNFAQSLLQHRLVDRLNLYVYPILLGQGKRLWTSVVAPAQLTLLGPAITGPKGAVVLRYAVERQEPTTGDMSAR
jgi:dihydrofolate reductase